MHVRNVCEETREEYEHLLAKLIEQIKAEIAAEKERLRQEEKTGKKQRVFGGKHSQRPAFSLSMAGCIVKAFPTVLKCQKRKKNRPLK